MKDEPRPPLPDLRNRLALNPTETAAWLGISVRHLRRIRPELGQAGIVVSIGSKQMYLVRKLERYMEQQGEATAARLAHVEDQAEAEAEALLSDPR